MEKKEKPLITIVDFLAGGLAGMAQVIVGQPFDIVKTRLQISTQKASVLEIAKNIANKEGLLAFYKGTLTPLLGISFAVANQIAGYELAKRYIAKKVGGDSNLTPIHLMLAGCFGGLFLSVLLSPIELFRIKMQILPGTGIAYKSSVDAGIQIYKTQGLRGVFCGYSATAVREILGSGVWLGTYESLLRTQLHHYNNNRKNMPSWKVALCGSSAGIAMWLAVYPADVIKSKIQGSDFNNTQYKTLFGSAKLIIQQKGFTGLYVGLGPAVFRTVFTSGGNFIVLEKIYNFFEKRNDNKAKL